MTTDTRRPTAHRIHLLLRRELGQGIEVDRLLAEALYARDVLLVCDALPGSELAALARQFRQAPDAPADGEPSRPAGWQTQSSGFGVSRPLSLDSDPSLPADLPGEPRHAETRRSWSPVRWLSRD